LFSSHPYVVIISIYWFSRPTPWSSRAASAFANGAAFNAKPASQLSTTTSLPAVASKYPAATTPTTGEIAQ
jgi:hypothetical protein